MNELRKGWSRGCISEMNKIVKDVTFLHLQQQDFECYLLPSKQCPPEGVMRNFASLVPMLENGLT